MPSPHRRPLRVGLLGSGWIAERHARAVQAAPEAIVSVIASPTAENARRLASTVDAAWTTSWEEVAGDGEVDAVVLCSPNALHAPQALAALDAGKHVLVEKPMATSAGDAEAMIAVARSRGRVLLVGHMWRYRDEVVAFRDAVRAGRFGAVERTRSHGCHVDFAPGGWFLDHALSGGGALIDLGIHAIDTTRFVLDEPEPASIAASIVPAAGHPGIDASGLLTVEWTSGVVSEIDFGWWREAQGGLIADTEVFGSNGHGRIWDPEPAAGYEHGGMPMYERQMRDFAARSAAHPPGSDGFDPALCEPGRMALAIALGGYAAAEAGRR